MSATCMQRVGITLKLWGKAAQRAVLQTLGSWSLLTGVSFSFLVSFQVTGLACVTRLGANDVCP